MKLQASFLKSIGLVLALAGCVTTEVNKSAPLVNYSPSVLAHMSPDQLKQELRTYFGKSDFVRHAPYKGADVTWYDGTWAVTTFGVDGVFMKFKNAAPNYSYRPDSPDPTHAYGFFYDELADVAFNTETCTTKAAPLPHGMKLQIYPILPPVGPELCDTLYSLGQYFKRQKETDAAAFATQAAEYRRQSIKPTMSEDQRRLVVQSESARQRKEYAEAADLLRAAVRMDPVAYPQAYFNLALLYEQQEQYAHAIDAMKRYLLLLPSAQDARAAQDKIYEWEGLAGRQ